MTKPVCAHFLGDPAADVADKIIDGFVTSEKVMRSHHAWSNVTNVLAARWDAPFEPIPGLPRSAVEMNAVASAVDMLWRKARVVYAMDPLMVGELANSTSDELFGEVLRRIPHTNPLMVFPQPLPTVLGTGQAGKLMGFYVYGKHSVPGQPRRASALVTTDDPGMESLGLMFVTAVLDSDGHEIDQDLLRVTVPLSERFTLDDAVERSLDGFRLDHTTAMSSSQAVESSLRAILPTALSCLLYACTDRPDIAADPHASRAITPGAPRQANQRGKRDRPGRPTRLLRVGWRLGPALHDARRAAAEYEATGPPGHGQAPHQRRGHFKQQVHGPARALRKLIYLAPYMVRLDLLDQLDNRVIPVR